jgi:hypothetical protein
MHRQLDVVIKVEFVSPARTLSVAQTYENQTAPGLGNREGVAGPQTACVVMSSWWHLLCKAWHCLAGDRRLWTGDPDAFCR